MPQPAADAGIVSLRLEWLFLGGVIVLAGWGFREAIHLYPLMLAPREWRTGLWQHVSMHDVLAYSQLALGLALTLPTARRSGLCFGALRGKLLATALVCYLPVLLTAAVYPYLREQPYAGYHLNVWLIGPIAEELIFRGYLQGRFQPLFSAWLHPRLRIQWATLLSAFYFSAWHLQNADLGVEFLLFQLAYTFLGGILLGLARQWTGSIVHGTVSHILVNLIACYPD